MQRIFALLVAIGAAMPPVSAAEPAAEPLETRGPTEVLATAITDPKVQRCVASQRRMAKKLRWTILRIQATSSPEFGEIWRADVATSMEPPIVSRLVCTNSESLYRPLKMPSRKRSIPPLQ